MAISRLASFFCGVVAKSNFIGIVRAVLLHGNRATYSSRSRDYPKCDQYPILGGSKVVVNKVLSPTGRSVNVPESLDHLVYSLQPR